MPQRTGYNRNTASYHKPQYKPPAAASKKVEQPTKEVAASKATPAPSKKAKTHTLKQIAEAWLGTPYKYGGQKKTGTDCSGFVLNVMMQWKSIALPHSTKESWKIGKSVSKRNLKQGDVVFFGSMWGVNHNGIYMGNNQFIHASSSKGVMYSSMDDAYWKPKYKGARRYY